MKPMHIGLIIAVIVIIILLIMRWRKNHAHEGSTGWTDDHRDIISKLLVTKPIFNCKSPEVIKCLLISIEKNYEFPRAMTLLQGNITPTDMANLIPCLNEECMTDVLMSENKDLPRTCATCMVKKALVASKDDKMIAGSMLHNKEALGKLLTSCLSEGCSPKPASGPVAMLSDMLNSTTGWTLPGCC